MARTRTITRYRARPRRRVAHKSKTISVAVIAGLAPMAIKTWQNFNASKDPKEIPGTILSSLTGYVIGENKFDFKNLNYGLWPILGGVLIHKLAGKVGINRAIARAGIPWARI